MRLQRVDFDTDETPVTAVFELTLNEIVLLYNLTGRTAPTDVTAAGGRDQKWGEALDDVASCLGGAFLNRFYEGGASDFPKFSVYEIAAHKAERVAQQEKT